MVDAYALTLASLLLVAGALGDRYGRRGALLVGIVLFGVGSLLSAFADSGGQLIAFRALTGVGGALIMPGTLSTITSVFPPAERARAVGIWAGFAGAGGTLGMLGAGWMLGQFSWPSIFFVTAAGRRPDLRGHRGLRAHDTVDRARRPRPAGHACSRRSASVRSCSASSRARSGAGPTR